MTLKVSKPKLMPDCVYESDFKHIHKDYLCDLVWECVKLDCEPPYEIEEVHREVLRWIQLTHLQRKKTGRVDKTPIDTQMLPQATSKGETDGSDLQ